MAVNLVASLVDGIQGVNETKPHAKKRITHKASDFLSQSIGIKMLPTVGFARRGDYIQYFRRSNGDPRCDCVEGLG